MDLSANLEHLARVAQHPFALLWIFLLSSVLLIWRLECLTRRGMEGTLLGSLIMPYCSGLGNVLFVFILLRANGPGSEMLINCFVNNITNLTLILGLCACFGGLTVSLNRRKISSSRKISARQRQRDEAALRESEEHRLHVLFSLLAGIFFTVILWALGRDGEIDGNDGMVLIGIFLFWQAFHIYEVMKNRVRENRRSFDPFLIVDFFLILAAGVGIFWSTETLVEWIMNQEGAFVGEESLGWITGWLMVLPNAGLALYYVYRRRPEVVYASQVGDGHICIPLCIGLFAMAQTISVEPLFFSTAITILLGAYLLHGIFLFGLRRLPAWFGVLLVATYGAFLFLGLVE